MADEKIISVRLRALTADLESGMARAGASIRGFQASADRDLQAFGNTLRNAGRSMTVGLTVPIAAGFALAIQQSISFEQAMAGVAKTMDLTDAEFEAMADGIRQMAMELPASREEIAGVAEAAGQLGIAKENVLEFTRTMIDLGVSTNLSAQEAATALAQFANITQLPQDQFDNLGSAIVALGNAGAGTESDIVALGTRLAAAGTMAGLTSAEIMGLANSMVNVGIEAEMGGTAMSMVLNRMRDAAIDGGPALEAFAAAAGMTANQFARLFQEDPTAAIEAFVQGLNRVVESGGTVTPIMEGIGLTGERVRDTLSRLANAAGQVGGNFDLASSAFAENSALAEEAARRYETTGSQMTIAWNQITDAAMTAGDVLVPIVAGMARGIASLAQSFAALPGPVQTFIVALAGIAAAVGPLLVIAGSLINAWALVGPAIASAGAALQTLLLTNPELVAFAAAAAAAATALALFGSGTGDMEAQRDHIEELTNAARDLGSVLAESGSEAFLVEVMQRLIDISPEVVDALTAAGVSISDLIEMIASGMSLSGEGEMFDQIIDQMGLTGDEADALRGRLADLAYQISIALGASDAEARAAALEATSDGLQGVGSAADDAAGGISNLNQEINEYIGQTQGLEGARDALVGAFADLRQSLIDNGSAWQGSSDAALANRDAGRQVIETFAQVVEQLDATGAGANQFARAGQNAIDQLRQLNADGLLTDGQLAVLEGRIRGFPELHLNADGSQARAELQRTLAAMTPYERRQFRAFLRATGDQARAELQRTLAAMTPYERRQFRAFLGADGSHARQEAATTSDHINRALAREFRARMRGDGSQARREATTTSDHINRAFVRIFRGTLDANNVPARNAIAAAIAQGNDWASRTFTATLATTGPSIHSDGGSAHGDYFRATPGGVRPRIAEGGYDEAVITSDPRYRDRQLGLLARLGFGGISGPAAAPAPATAAGQSNNSYYFLRSEQEMLAAVPAEARTRARAFLAGRS